MSDYRNAPLWNGPMPFKELTKIEGPVERHIEQLWDEIQKLKQRVSKMEQQKCKDALELAISFGGIQGEHHKAWVIDQIVRILAGEKYEEVIREACDGEDGPNSYDWDVGIAP